MTKVVLGILIVCFTTFCGHTLAKKYRQRKDFFRQLNGLNERFLSEISYFKRPLKEFLGGYPLTGEFSELIEEYAQYLESGKQEEIYSSDFAEISFLTADEKSFVRDYFLTLGRGDSASQKAYFSSVKSTLTGYKNGSEEACKRYGDLYIKLGFLFGLAVLVLIV